MCLQIDLEPRKLNNLFPGAIADHDLQGRAVVVQALRLARDIKPFFTTGKVSYKRLCIRALGSQRNAVCCCIRASCGHRVCQLQIAKWFSTASLSSCCQRSCIQLSGLHGSLVFCVCFSSTGFRA